MSFQHSKNELYYARKDFETFKTYENPFEAYVIWNRFVSYLGTAFNSLQHVKNFYSPAFSKMVKKAIEKRKTDPLLRYLLESRNAYQHSPQELSSLEAINNIPVDTFRMSKADEFGNPIPGTEEEHPIYSSTLFLKPVVDNRNKNNILTYHPPTEHLNKPLNGDRSPYEVGELALRYYETLYNNLSKLI